MESKKRNGNRFSLLITGCSRLLAASVNQSVNPCEVKPPTGEPDAGEPHVRFGGGRGRVQPALPTPIRGDVIIVVAKSHHV